VHGPYIQWATESGSTSGLPKRALGGGLCGPRDHEAQENRRNMLLGQNMSEVMSPRLAGPQRYARMVTDLEQLKAELKSVSLSRLGAQLDELMSTASPRSARRKDTQPLLYGAATPCAANVRGRGGVGSYGQFSGR
jgi:hypothetical protein